jgi:hypothetical protein
VHVVWRENGRECSESFRLSGSDARELLDEVSRRTGTPWTNSDLVGDLARGAAHRLLLRLPVETTVGRTTLPRGRYLAVYTENDNHSGMLYFFIAAHATQEGVLLAVPITVRPLLSGEPTESQVITDGFSPVRVVDFRFSGKVLSLFSPPAI